MKVISRRGDYIVLNDYHHLSYDKRSVKQSSNCTCLLMWLEDRVARHEPKLRMEAEKKG